MEELVQTGLLYMIGAPVVIATITMSAMIVVRGLKSMGFDSLQATKAYKDITKQ